MEWQGLCNIVGEDGRGMKIEQCGKHRETKARTDEITKTDYESSNNIDSDGDLIEHVTRDTIA
jgi:hypothetical protein